MKKGLLFITGLAILMVIASCAPLAEEGGDDPEVLDLRIKNNGDPAELRTVTEHGVVNDDGSVQTTHVRAEAVEGGILFTITTPDDVTYDDGFGYVAIYRVESVGQTTNCVLPGGVTSYEPILYPFCEAGETYEFKVQLESIYSNENGRVDQYMEYLTITATDGIGDIDYSNVNDKQWFSAAQDGDDAVFTIVDCIPPEALDVYTSIDFFVGDGDWSNPATKWIADYYGTGVEYTVTNSDLIELVLSEGYTQFFAEYTFRFTLEDYPQFQEIRTMAISSNVVTIE